MQSLANANINLNQLNIITQQTQYKEVNSLAGGVWVLGRTIQQEYHQLNCKLIDLGRFNSDDQSPILSELLNNDGETQVAYYQQQRYVPRLTPKDNILDRPCRLQLSPYGTMDNLALTPMKRQAPAAGEIEISVAEYRTSVSASRVLSGERPIHLELEQEIADFIGTEAAIVYVGGHATNVSPYRKKPKFSK